MEEHEPVDFEATDELRFLLAVQRAWGTAAAMWILEKIQEASNANAT